MDGGDQLTSLISALHALQLVTVHFLIVSCISQSWCLVQLLDLWGSVVPLENNLNFLIHTTVASCTMFIWDYILTFRMEVNLVWKSKWNFMKGLYLFQCYLPFIDHTWLVLYCQPNPFSTFFPSYICSSNGEWFDKKFMCEDTPFHFRFVK